MPSFRNHNSLLTRVNFPLYTISCLGERHILIAGGGGNSNSGISNVIEIYELINDGKSLRAESVAHYETGSEAVMNATLYNAGKYFILFTGMNENCHVYKINYENSLHSDGILFTSLVKDEGGHNANVKRRKIGVEEKDSDEQSNLSLKQMSNKMDNISNIKFTIRSLESFRTDFHPYDSFQKLVKFSSNSKILATAGADGHIRIWKYPALNMICEIEAHKADVDAIDICPLGTRIVSVSRDGTGKIWNIDGTLIANLVYNLPPKFGGKYIFRSCVFGIVKDKNDLALFATLNPATYKKNYSHSFICKWNTKDYAMEKIASTGTEMLSVMAISKDGTFIGLGTQDGSVKVYIAFSLQLIHNFAHVHRIFVTGLEFLPASEKARRITGDMYESSLLSISVDNQINIHHIPFRASMRFSTFILLFVITLFIIFITLDYCNL